MEKQNNENHILIVGAGSIGRRHARNLKSLGVKVSLFDVDQKHLEMTCLQDGYTVCNNLEYAITHEVYDAAIVCTPTHLHIPVAQTMCDAKINLFIEKPLSHNLVGIRELLDSVSKNNLIAMMGFMLRFEPGLQYIKDRMNPDTIAFAQVEAASHMPLWRPGTDYRKSYSANRSMGGGVILDDVHEIDYICWFFGYPEKISGNFGKYSSIEMDAEDTAMLQFQYPDKLVSLHSDYLQRRNSRRCKLCDRDGFTVEWEFGSHVTEYKEDVPATFSYKDGFDTNQLYLDEMRHFLLCINTRTQPESNLMNGLEILKIALAAKNEL